jgi:predicted DNA-binding transcriptional regulator AlpA
LPPLAVDAKRLAQLLSAGVRTIRTWDAAGKLPKPFKLGGRTLWYLPEIRAWLRAGAPHRERWEVMKTARRK